MLIIHLIMGHTLILLSQMLIGLTAHDGVHKETPSIACHFRVRQFRFANLDNGIPHLLRCRLVDTLPLQFRTDITVVQMGLESLFQHIGDCRDQIFVFPFILKPALTIAIFTGLLIDGAHLTCGNLHRIYTK